MGGLEITGKIFYLPQNNMEATNKKVISFTTKTVFLLVTK